MSEDKSVSNKAEDIKCGGGRLEPSDLGAAGGEAPHHAAVRRRLRFRSPLHMQIVLREKKRQDDQRLDDMIGTRETTS